AHGARLPHVPGGQMREHGGGPRSYQPMNVNFGLFPPLPPHFEREHAEASLPRARGKARELGKKRALAARALADLEHWIGGRVLDRDDFSSIRHPGLLTSGA